MTSLHSLIRSTASVAALLAVGGCVSVFVPAREPTIRHAANSTLFWHAASDLTPADLCMKIVRVLDARPATGPDRPQFKPGDPALRFDVPTGDCQRGTTVFGELRLPQKGLFDKGVEQFSRLSLRIDIHATAAASEIEFIGDFTQPGGAGAAVDAQNADVFRTIAHKLEAHGDDWHLRVSSEGGDTVGKR